MKQLLIALTMFLVPVAYAGSTDVDNFNTEVELLARQMNSTGNVQSGNVEKKQLTIPPFDLMKFLNFDGCRMTQDEHSHHSPKGGSMFAIDVACDEHESYTITAPNYLYGDYKYTVAKVGKDKYLGDYITIDFALPDNKVGTLVYGHTSTPLKVGDTLKAGELIGMYSPSGKTTGPHTHIELWEGGKNITFDMKEFNPKSLRLRVQRGRTSYSDIPTVVNVIKETASEVGDLLFRTMKFIIHFEGFRSKAYHDGSTRYSIGYGTKSYQGEVISQETARARMQVAVEKRLNTVLADFPNANDNQKIALSSLLYNCPSGYRKVLKYGATKNNRMYCSTAGGKFMRGLYNRRLSERAKYNE